MSEQDQTDITRQMTNIVVHNLEHLMGLRDNLQEATTEQQKANRIDEVMAVFCKTDGCDPMVQDFVSVAKLYINWSEVQRRLEAGK